MKYHSYSSGIWPPDFLFVLFNINNLTVMALSCYPRTALPPPPSSQKRKLTSNNFDSVSPSIFPLGTINEPFVSWIVIHICVQVSWNPDGACPVAYCLILHLYIRSRPIHKNKGLGFAVSEPCPPRKYVLIPIVAVPFFDCLLDFWSDL